MNTNAQIDLKRIADALEQIAFRNHIDIEERLQAIEASLSASSHPAALAADELVREIRRCWKEISNYERREKEARKGLEEQ